MFVRCEMQLSSVRALHHTSVVRELCAAQPFFDGFSHRKDFTPLECCSHCAVLSILRFFLWCAQLRNLISKSCNHVWRSVERAICCPCANPIFCGSSTLHPERFDFSILLGALCLPMHLKPYLFCATHSQSLRNSLPSLPHTLPASVMIYQSMSSCLLF